MALMARWLSFLLRIAALLVVHADLRPLRVEFRDDPEVTAALAALTEAGNRWRTSATSANTGSRLDAYRECPGESESMTTTEAAKRCGISDRAIRLALDEGRLAGEKNAAGRWRITQEQLTVFDRNRAA